MTERTAIRVTCRIIVIWLAVTAARSALVGGYMAAQFSTMRTGADGNTVAMLMRGYWTSLGIELGLGLLLWFSAPILANAGRDSVMRVDQAFDITGALLKALGVYFMVTSVATLARFAVAFSQPDSRAHVASMERSADITQALVFLIAGLCLMLGADRIKKAMLGVSRFGLEDEPDSPSEQTSPKE